MSGTDDMRLGDVRTVDPRAWRTAIIVTVVAALVRLFFAAWLPLFPDETYYWDCRATSRAATSIILP